MQQMDGSIHACCHHSAPSLNPTVQQTQELNPAGCNLDQLAVKKKRKNGRLFGSMQGYLPLP